MGTPVSIRETILTTLNNELKPIHIELVDESHMHSRQTQLYRETHFKLIIVSPAFEGLSLVKRQKLVYSFLTPLFDQGLHALTQSTFTPDEWSNKPEVHESPDCGHKMQKHAKHARK